MVDPATPDEKAEKILRDYVARSGITFINKHGSQAFYQPSTDTIVVPEISQFISTAEYYGAAFHEATHSTGNPNRLNRITNIAAFGSEEYSKEELIAEMGAAFLVSIAGLETAASFHNSAAYIRGWLTALLTALQNDKRLVVAAAGAAQKAVEYILGSKEADENA